LTKEWSMMASESLPFSNIELNPSWVYDAETSNGENFIFSVLTSSDRIPVVLIENTDGRFRLQFRKENSSIRLNGNQLWYNKNYLTSILRLPSTLRPQICNT
jgi:hypothetical protein